MPVWTECAMYSTRREMADAIDRRRGNCIAELMGERRDPSRLTQRFATDVNTWRRRRKNDDQQSASHRSRAVREDRCDPRRGASAATRTAVFCLPFAALCLIIATKLKQ